MRRLGGSLRLPRLGWSSGGASAPWYLTSGVTADDVIAAISPEGATDITDAYRDLAHPGTPHIAAGAAAPTWDAVNGLKSGGTGYITTDIVPPQDNSYTWIIKYSGLSSSGNRAILGSSKTGGGLLQVLPNNGGGIYYAIGGNVKRNNPVMSACVLALSGGDLYRNGLVEYRLATPNLVYLAPYIFGRNDDGAINATTLVNCNIQKIVVYNKKLTHTQIYDISRAMGASARNTFWTRDGEVIKPTQAAEGVGCQEPSVILEGDPQILADALVYKAWYSANNNICYAESADGITWTKLAGNPVITGHRHSSVFKIGATYYFYGTLNATAKSIDLYTSADGVTWTAYGSNPVITSAKQLGNTFVWQEDATHWYMMLEDYSSGWRLNLYTSADGITWSGDAGNPVLVKTGAMAGGPWVWKNPTDGRYWMWLHVAQNGDVPTDVARYYSDDLVTWTASPVGVTLRRFITDIEAVQTADPFLVEENGRVHIFYTCTPDGTSVFSISRATVNMTLAQLVETPEGV